MCLSTTGQLNGCFFSPRLPSERLVLIFSKAPEPQRTYDNAARLRALSESSSEGVKWFHCRCIMGKLHHLAGRVPAWSSRSLVGDVPRWKASSRGRSCHCVSCRGLIAADYQKQSLAGQKSSASSRANCTLSGASSAWTESERILTTGQHVGSTVAQTAVDFSPTSSRLHSSCISPSICSTNSSVSRIYTGRAA